MTWSRFLSTPSARRATWPDPVDLQGGQDFYPRPPRGGRQLRRGDTGRVDKFLSTPSARRATFPQIADALRVMISIHALREEGDNFDFTDTFTDAVISIHALREEGDLSPPIAFS